MTGLLVLVGASIAFVVGVWWGGRRSGAGLPAPLPEAEPEPAPTFELIEHHRDGFVLADDSGRVVYRNEAARRLQGTHVGVLIGEAIDRHIEIAAREGSSHEVLEMYGPPKVVLVVEAHALASGVVVYVDDISEQRRVEQVRTDFVANISHELKTPVGAMSVLAETLEDEHDPATIRRVVSRMMDEAQRATRTIDDLMELSRIELGGERVEEPVPVTAVLAEAMDRVTEMAGRRQIGLTNLASADQLEGVTIHGDRRQLVSALGNLVENAVKYSEPGGHVQIRTRVADGDVEFAVIDHGIGIPQRDLDRIFERFYRVDRARSRVTGGTGLGLSIVRHVASSHGGSVAVQSTEGEGSVFTLRLPTLAGTQRLESVGGTDSARGDGDTPGLVDGGDHEPSDAGRGIA